MFATRAIKEWLIITVSFFVALALMFLRLPVWVATWLYPQWLILIALYWVWVMPQRVNVGVAWLMGILLDILYNVPVGEHALALVIAAYFMTRFSVKIALLDFWGKIGAMFAMVTMSQLLPSVIRFFSGESHPHFWPIISRSIVGALVWLVIVFCSNQRSKNNLENYY